MSDTPDPILADLATNVRNARQAAEDAQTTLAIAQEAATTADATLEAARTALGAYITSLTGDEVVSE
jgi:hypothetical protein